RGEGSEYIVRIMFGAGGKTIGVMGDHGSVQTWDAITGKWLWEANQREVVEFKHFNLRDWYTAVKGRPGLRIVDTTTGREVVRVMQENDAQGSDVDPGRNRLVVFRDKQLWVYDTGSAQEDRRIAFDGEGGFINARSPNGKYVAVVSDKEIA